MNPEDRIDEWARERASCDVPEGFADRVMAAVVGADGPRRRPFLEIAAVALAAVAGALRVAAAFAIFSTSCGVAP